MKKTKLFFMSFMFMVFLSSSTTRKQIIDSPKYLYAVLIVAETGSVSPATLKTKQRILNEINVIASSNNLTPIVKTFAQETTSPQDLKNALDGIPNGKSGIVLMWIIAHGYQTNDYNRTDRFPLINMRNEDISSWQLHEKIKSKNTHLALTFVEACQSVSESVVRNDVQIARLDNHFYQKLFLGYTGDIIVSSTSPGQYSHVDTLNRFSYFSDFLLLEFKGGQNLPNSVLSDSGFQSEWHKIFAITSRKAKTAVNRDFGAVQDAQIKINIEEVKNKTGSQRGITEGKPTLKVSPEKL